MPTNAKSANAKKSQIKVRDMKPRKDGPKAGMGPLKHKVGQVGGLIGGESRLDGVVLAVP